MTVMQADISPLVQSALRLIKCGRFSDAVTSLEQDVSVSGSLTRATQFRQCLLADALQRTGRNEAAESITLENLKLVSNSPELASRYQFVLGNICRERGDTQTAIEHLQAAAKLADADLELSCWVQLRLMAAIAELGGSRTAMVRLEEVKRKLTRFGEPRPFAALHLWIAEAESLRGSLDSACRHLGIAKSLLGQIDDVWLQGFLAINSSCVHYHCGEISEARKWAELAIECARASGHQGARRAAHANLGHIEFSLGHLSKAEECFESALAYCEGRSANYIAVLDSIAQVKLHRGDLPGCRSLLSKLEHVAIHNGHAKSNHYRSWALQTKIQLLLKEGLVAEAKQLCEQAEPISQDTPPPRISTVLQLLTVETLIANREFTSAAQRLASIMSASVELPPDLFAEMERVIAKTLCLSGAVELGRTHLERAIKTFDVIGHSIGREGAMRDSAYFPRSPIQSADASVATRSLDRFRTLLDTRRKPEIFAHEAFSLLEELTCSQVITLGLYSGSHLVEVSREVEAQSSPPRSIPSVTIDLGKVEEKDLRLSFVPKQEPTSIMAALAFRRVIERLLVIRGSESEFADCEVLWSANEWLSNQGVVFAAESMHSILRTLGKISPTNLSVLITGETGTGKEVLARAIHERSGRTSKPFVALNCAAVPKDLLESQLFGYRRGAFSGASEPFQGVIRAANGGTLLLDEIGEISLEMQPKLLRFLESGEVHPLGEAHPIKVDVRLLFATNTNLEDAVKQGRFREDLFFRMNIIPVQIPPLRERREEIPLLVNLFADRFARELSREPTKFATDTMELLILYSWPGNVRQLLNEVRRLVNLADDGVPITPRLLSSSITGSNASASKARADSGQITLSLDHGFAHAVTSLERTMVEQALRKANGHVATASRILGISRKGLYLKRQRLGLLDTDRRRAHRQR